MVEKQKKARCPVCNKKLGLMVFKCKCNIRFCLQHSSPELHNCTYDHKSIEREELEKKLVKVTPNKVIPI